MKGFEKQAEPGQYTMRLSSANDKAPAGLRRLALKYCRAAFLFYWAWCIGLLSLVLAGNELLYGISRPGVLKVIRH